MKRKSALFVITIVLLLLVTVLAGCSNDVSYDPVVDVISDDGLNDEPVYEPGDEVIEQQAEDYTEEYAQEPVERITGPRGGQRTVVAPRTCWWINYEEEDRPGYGRFIDGRFFSAEMTGFDLSDLGFSSARMVQNIEQLQYMVNLTELRLWQAHVGDLSPLSGLTNLTILSLGNNQISDLSPLADLTNLTHLYLFGNQISDLSTLSELTNLTHLALFDNQISDLTPLSGLTNLTVLELSSNQIEDLTPLSGLAGLEELSLSGNQISDIAPLESLTNLRYLSLSDNPITYAVGDAQNINVFDSISVEVGEIIEFGDFTWLVLDVQDGYAMIITENSFRAGLGQYNNQYLPITWETSFARHYLNGEYLLRFSPAERSRIRETLVVNDNNPWFGTNGGNDTIDRIFILSIAEVVEYFGDSGQLDNSELSDWWWGIYDEYNSARVATDIDGLYAWTWLRSRGNRPALAAGVDGVGAISISGTGVSNTAGRVRPVLWLYLGSY